MPRKIITPSATPSLKLPELKGIGQICGDDCMARKRAKKDAPEDDDEEVTDEDESGN